MHLPGSISLHGARRIIWLRSRVRLGTIARYISLFVRPRLREPLPPQSIAITNLLDSIRSARLKAGFESPFSMHHPALE
jgi:hypothetical protein